MKRDERRKNEWKYAQKRKQILLDAASSSLADEKALSKPIHYYANNPPRNGYARQPNKTNNKGSRRYISKNYQPSKNWSEHDQRQIDNLNDQLEDLNDTSN